MNDNNDGIANETNSVDLTAFRKQHAYPEPVAPAVPQADVREAMLAKRREQLIAAADTNVVTLESSVQEIYNYWAPHFNQGQATRFGAVCNTDEEIYQAGKAEMTLFSVNKVYAEQEAARHAASEEGQKEAELTAKQQAKVDKAAEYKEYVQACQNRKKNLNAAKAAVNDLRAERKVAVDKAVRDACGIIDRHIAEAEEALRNLKREAAPVAPHLRDAL